MALDSVREIVVAFTVGKRQLPNAHDLLHQVHERSPNDIPYFTSDELDHYTAAIREEYGIEKRFEKTVKRVQAALPTKD